MSQAAPENDDSGLQNAERVALCKAIAKYFTELKAKNAEDPTTQSIGEHIASWTKEYKWSTKKIVLKYTTAGLHTMASTVCTMSGIREYGGNARRQKFISLMMKVSTLGLYVASPSSCTTCNCLPVVYYYSSSKTL
jgi:hypothetical protein